MRNRLCAAAGIMLLAASVISLPATLAGAASQYDLFAVVAADGILARGTPGTTVSHLGTGLYDVTFPQSVSKCAAVANLGYTGNSEVFIFQSAVTASTGPHGVVHVDVTYPGPTTAGHYPHTPVLEDNSFHLHVDCNNALDANVAADGTLRFGSPGVTSSHLGTHPGTGLYLVSFAGHYLQGCAPVATVQNPGLRTASAVQTFIALGANLTSLEISVNKATTAPVDRAFSLIVTCAESPTGLFPSSIGFNQATVPNAASCALTSSWITYTAGGPPSDQGYVSTWYTSANSAGVLTKNGGYGVTFGNGVDLVATC